LTPRQRAGAPTHVDLAYVSAGTKACSALDKIDQPDDRLTAPYQH